MEQEIQELIDEFARLKYRLDLQLPDGYCLHSRVRTVEPDKRRIGQVEYADGVNWNPGSGEGLYVYKSGGWAFIA